MSKVFRFAYAQAGPVHVGVTRDDEVGDEAYIRLGTKGSKYSKQIVMTRSQLEDVQACIDKVMWEITK